MERNRAAVRVLIVDDHAVVRQGLRMFLSLDTEIEIVGEARDGREAVELARELRPAVVLMDILMPRMDGIEATAAIRREMPEIQVLALTSVLEDSSVIGAVKAGAIGYLLKNANPDELRQAIKAAATGEMRFSPEASVHLIAEVRAPNSPESLTPRETAVLRLIALGKSNKEIADELHLGTQTVKTHVSNILAKLSIKSRTQAALYAIKIGLVSVSEPERS